MLALAFMIMLLIIEKAELTQTFATVARDGSGMFGTIADAITTAPNYSTQKYYINIKKGVYYEHIIVAQEKTNIVLIGEGLENTIISGERSNANGFSLEDTATVGILGDGFMAQGISFENLAGPEGNQALAVHVNAEATFYQCRFIGYQDTLYAHDGKQFYRDCEILGTIDFIFGDSTTVFQNCIIRLRQPLPNQYATITAQGSIIDTEQKSGFVFQNCTINTQDLQKDKTRCYLGRPWKDFSTSIFMQSFIDIIEPEGWIAWGGKVPVHPFFAEYANRGPGANTLARVKWSTIIVTRKEASQFTVRNFLNEGTWIPPTVPRYLDLLESNSAQIARSALERIIQTVITYLLL